VKVKDLRKDESKYPGLIMEKISFHRWHETRTGVISAKKISEILSEANKDFPDLFTNVEEKFLTNEEFKNLLVKQNRERLDWKQKWFGKT